MRSGSGDAALTEAALGAPAAFYTFRRLPSGEYALPFVSPLFAARFGLDPGDPVEAATRFFARIHPDDVDRARDTIARSAQTLEPFELEFRYRLSSGEEIWVEARSQPERAADGGVIWHGIATEITARMAAEEALRESEERYRSFLDSVPIGFYRTTPEGQVLLANPALLTMLGYDSFDELRARNLERGGFEPEYSREEFKKTIEKDGRIWGRETAWTRRDGSVVFVRESARAVRGPDGDVLSYDGTVEDVTHTRRAEAALRESEKRYRRIVEMATEGIWVVDADLRTTLANRAFARMLGYEPEEMVGTPAQLYTFPEDLDELDKHANALRQGVEETYERRFRRKDGRECWCLVSGTPVFEFDGRFAGSFGMLTDITERRALQEQLRQSQKMEAVGLLAGGIAHDFNNLLTVISGNVEILLATLRKDDPMTLVAGEIRHAGERAAALTRQLLAFSRKQVLAPKIVNLNEIVASAEKLLRRLIGEDVALTCLLDPDLSPVKVDPVQFEQVIFNLAVNARDAMPRGGSLTIETRSAAGPGRPPGDQSRVLLRIADTGVGMSADVRAHLFEPFFTTKEAGKGSGLGLATVYGVVKQSEGDIAVESEEGAGTTFRILLPAVEATRQRNVSDHRIRAIPHGDETVLLVEDEEAVRKIVHQILGSSGYRVLVAPGGREALKIAREHAGPIHLLITDVVMPGMGGRELAEALHRENPRIRVLFISGYTDDAIVRKGVLEEKSRFLQKPFSPLTLAKEVREVLDADEPDPAPSASRDPR